MIPISLPATGDEEWLAVREPILKGWLTQGAKVSEFERRFAARHEVKHAIAVTSCTTGLHLALLACGIQPGDEVLVPAFTWISTANAVLYCGATPVLVDVDPRTYNICPIDLAKRVTPKTRALIVVHLFGLCVDMSAVREVVPSHVRIIEDCACAAGASWRGSPAGGLGACGVFSFHPRKSITTGEGGMITTNDENLAHRVDSLRNHGASIPEEQRHLGPTPYLLPEFNVLGFNYRMTDLQGAVGLAQLAKLDRFIAERDRGAAMYLEELAAIPWIGLPHVPADCSHAWQAFVTYVDPAKAPCPRNQIMERLQSMGVATRPGTHAVHMLGYYADRYGLEPDDYPGAASCDRNTMAIPLHNRMADADYRYVIDCLKAIV